MKRVLAFLSIFLVISALAQAELRKKTLELFCDQIMAHSLRYRNHVTEPVIGLYDSIPVSKSFNFKDFIFETHSREINDERQWGFALITDIKARDKKVGSFESWFSNDLIRMRLSQWVRGIPNFLYIPGTLALIPKKGIPTETYITLMQMKMAGVSYGGLKYIETDNINDLVTSLELILDPYISKWITEHPKAVVPNVMIADKILDTLTGRTLSTMVTQSGHNIRYVEVVETEMTSVFGFPTDKKTEKDKYLNTLRRGLSLGDVMPNGFKLKIYLTPPSKRSQSLETQ